MKTNPYELGIAHYKAGMENSNPYQFPSEKWALYNRGYNSCWMPKKEK